VGQVPIVPTQATARGRLRIDRDCGRRGPVRARIGPRQSTASVASLFVELLNDGAGVFTQRNVSFIQVFEFTEDLTVGDFDGDGRNDVALSTSLEASL